MFLGERNAAPHGPGLASVYYNNNHRHNDNDNDSDSGSDAGGPVGGSGSNSNNHGPVSSATALLGQHGQLTPPDHFPVVPGETARMGSGGRAVTVGRRGDVLGWLEIWDYAGGSSFRGFVAEDTARDAKSLFVFFDAHCVTRDLKQAYAHPLLNPRHLDNLC